MDGHMVLLRGEGGRAGGRAGGRGVECLHAAVLRHRDGDVDEDTCQLWKGRKSMESRIVVHILYAYTKHGNTVPPSLPPSQPT